MSSAKGGKIPSSLAALLAEFGVAFGQRLQFVS